MLDEYPNCKSKKYAVLNEKTQGRKKNSVEAMMQFPSQDSEFCFLDYVDTNILPRICEDYPEYS